MTKKRFTFKTKTRSNQAYTQWYDNEKLINSAHKVIDLLNALHEENQRLKSRITYLEWKIERERASHQKQHEKWDKEAQNEINGIMELLKSYQKTVKHSAKLLADATKKGYLPPLEDWEEL